MVSPADEAQPRRRPRFRSLTVRRVEHVTPRMVRVTFFGNELEGFDSPAPTQHIKLIIPHPGEDMPLLPDPAGEPGQARPLMRTYTIRRFAPEVSEIDVDFVLHGDGPASEWAASAQPGATVAIAGPGGRPYTPDLDASWYVLAGDESALPAMGTLLERLPASIETYVYAEVPDASEQAALDVRNAHVTWLHRGLDGVPAGSLLGAALQDFRLPTGSGRLWLACEATVMHAVRRQLIEHVGLAREAVVTRGYWKAGEVNYPDHDYGED